MKQWLWAVLLVGMSASALADDCLREAREEREEHCGYRDEACHARVDRQLKHCLEREEHRHEWRDEAGRRNNPPPYIPGLPPPQPLPGWQ